MYTRGKKPGHLLGQYKYRRVKESSVEMDDDTRVAGDDSRVADDDNRVADDEEEEFIPQVTSQTLADFSQNQKTIVDPDRGRCGRFFRDKIYRTQFFHTCGLYMAFGVQGWIKGQFGPSFLDLQMITGTGQEECSWLMTMLFVGHILATPIGGYLYTKSNSFLTLGIAHLGLSAVVCAIPWCWLFPLMMTSYLVLGMILGFIDTIGNTEIFYVWKGKGKIHMQGLQLTFAFAGVLSPVVTAPFLLTPLEPPLQENVTTIGPAAQYNLTRSSIYTSKYSPTSTRPDTGNHIDTFPTSNTLPVTHQNPSEERVVRHSSRLYIAFSITGLLGLSVAIGFLVLFFYAKARSYLSQSTLTKENIKTKRTFPKFTKYKIMIILSVIMFLSSGIDFGFNTFFVSFLVLQLNWTKRSGSTLSSLVFLLEVVGRVSGLFLIRLICPETLTVFHCSVTAVVFLGLLVSAIFSANIGIWIFGSLFGYARSIIFPTVFIWTNERFFPVTGQTSAIFITAAACGITINPVAMGYIIEALSSIWFCYILLSESVLLLVMCIICFIMTRVIVRREGTPSRYPDIDKETSFIIK